MRRSLTLAAPAAALVLACNALFGIEAPVLDETFGADGSVDASDADAAATADAARDADPDATLDDAADAGDACANGACAGPCDGGLTRCGLACVDLQGNDPARCGACGRSCLAGACLGGACQPFDVARQQSSSLWVTVGADDVYWTSDDAATPRVGHAPKDGRAICTGAAAGCTVTPPPSSSPQAIHAHGIYVYIADITNNAVLRYPLDLLGTPATLVTAAGVPTSFAAAGTQLFWSSRSVEFVRTAPLGGGAASAIGTATSGTPSPWTIAHDGTNVWVSASTPGGGATAIQPGIYKLDPAAPCTGATCVPFRALSEIPYSVTLSGGWVYWSTLSGRVQRELVSGGCGIVGVCPQTVASLTASIRGLVVDGSTAYFTTDDGTLRKADVASSCAGAACTVLAGNLGRGGMMVQDTRAIYFVKNTPSVSNTGVVVGLVK